MAEKQNGTAEVKWRRWNKMAALTSKGKEKGGGQEAVAVEELGDQGEHHRN